MSNSRSSGYENKLKGYLVHFARCPSCVVAILPGPVGHHVLHYFAEWHQELNLVRVVVRLRSSDTC